MNQPILFVDGETAVMLAHQQGLRAVYLNPKMARSLRRNLQQISKADTMFKLKNEYFKGQRIRIINPAWADHTDGFATGNIVTITEPVHHEIGVVEAVNDAGTAGILYADEFEVVDAKEPSAPMTKSVLDLLRRKGAITSLEAQGVLRCRQLPARILELKRLGHKIVTELKFDPTGQKYARYHLQRP